MYRLQFDGGALHAHVLEAKLGKSGSLRVQGALPLQSAPAGKAATGSTLLRAPTHTPDQPSSGSTPVGPADDTLPSLGAVPNAQAGHTPSSADCWSSEDGTSGLHVDVKGADVRARGAYSGAFDARLTVRNSLAKPHIGGNMRFSKGIAYLMPPVRCSLSCWGMHVSICSNHGWACRVEAASNACTYGNLTLTLVLYTTHA
jgi:hypothetical protein